MKIEKIEVLKRGFKKVCPACGKGPIFDGWDLHETCKSCGLALSARDTWFFMYFSTAGITGIFLLAMYSIPGAFWIRVGLAAIAIPAFFLTIPLRKSLAVALDYLIPGG